MHESIFKRKRHTFRNKSNNTSHEGNKKDGRGHKVRVRGVDPGGPNNQNKRSQHDGQGHNDAHKASDLLADDRDLLLAATGQLVNAAHQGVIALEDNNTDSGTLDDVSAHEGNVLGLEEVFVSADGGSLDGLRLTSENGTVKASIVRDLNHAQVGGDLVTEREMDTITDNKVGGRDLDQLAITEDSAIGGDHVHDGGHDPRSRDILEGRERSLQEDDKDLYKRGRKK